MKKKGRVWSKLLVLFVALAMVFGTVSTAFAADPTKTATATDTPGEYKITLSTSGATVPVGKDRDYILIIDYSSSMYTNSKLTTVKSVLTGTGGNASQDGFLYDIFQKAGTTRVKIVKFGTTAEIVNSEWYTSASAAAAGVNSITTADNEYSTNYQQAFVKAENAYKSASSTADKYVLFLSDGEPTKYGDNGQYGNGFSCTEKCWEASVTAISNFNKTAAGAKGIYSIAFDTTPTATIYGLNKNGNSITVNGTTYKVSATDSWGSTNYYGPYNFMSQLTSNVYQASTTDLDKIIARITDDMNNMEDATIVDPINTTYFISSDTNIYNAENGFSVYKIDSATGRTDLTSSDYTLDTTNPNGVSVKLNNELKGSETLYVEFNIKVSDAGYEKIFADNNTENIVPTNLQGEPNGAFTNGSISGTTTDTFWYTSPTVSIPTGSAVLYKTDKDTNAPLTGAQFTLTRQGGNSPSRTISFDNQSSMTIANLPKGTYTLTETIAPDGYQADSTVYTIDVDASGAITSISPTEQNLSLGADGNLTFTNAAKMGQLTVSKSVTGNLASTTQDFTFTAAFKDASNNAVASDVYKYVDAEDTEQSLVLDKNGSMTFTLHHGQNVVFNLPQGVAYTVTETAVDGYNNTTVNGTETREATGNILETEATAAFVNNASSTVPSALTNDTTPFLFMAAGIGILGLALVISKRSKTKSGF